MASVSSSYMVGVVISTKFSADPIAMGAAINKGLLSMLEKARERNRILGENYPIYPEDNEKEIRA